MNTAVTHGIPEYIGDLKRDFIPYEAMEADFNFPKIGKSRRLRIVHIKSHDQNHLDPIIEDRGPARGEEGVYIACEGANEMAYVHELLDQAIRNRKARKLASALRLPERHEAIRLGLINYAEQAILAKAARSTFGPYQRTERSG